MALSYSKQKPLMKTLQTTLGNVDGTFSIDAENGTIILQKPLDYETLDIYELHVLASDGKFSSGTIVSIQVVDYNDNSPRFYQPIFSFSVPENVTTGHLVGSVNASDKDSYDNADIHYSISSVGNYDKFAINSSTGDIFTVTTLDTETVRNYVILVEANDTGNPSRVSTTLVTITALDVNGQPPEFVQRSFAVNISEASVIGTNIVCLSTTDRDSMQHAKIAYSITEENVTTNHFVGSVKASDRDSYENAHMFYSIPSVSEKFEINASTGEIFTIGALDYETVHNHVIMVEARDSGNPPRMAATLVNIAITDVNDNSPEFVHRHSTVNISEASTLGTKIVCLSTTDRDTMQHARAKVFENVPIGHIVINLTAQDKDSGSNGHVTYSLVDSPCDTDNVASEIFSINPTSGAITTSKKLKSSAPQVEYKFQVKASDNGIPSLESFTACPDNRGGCQRFTSCVHSL
ncbi:Cadherin EGF LAG seven-pass G-type receptor 2 [Desmophyllum pertusum]|uniref:Cadherin EGF LAG seven-pass G-type receptor 2 n=1 Tax=Desmophyllum pertusum TaxID=174260 RepID=A0A9W9ZIT1_9CNID|nr:Cadherin EGF LAG seven-pass G-type receptor 2 [Desmophyllum pertusum]